MASVTCPQCGTPVLSGAAICTACGHQLDEPVAAAPPVDVVAPEQANADAPYESPPPRTTLPGTEVPQKPRTSLDAPRLLNETRERWGVEASSPTFIAALLMAALAFLIGTYAVISYLIADLGEVRQKLDAAIWLQLASGAGIGAAALLVLERWRSSTVPADSRGLDLRVGLAICALVLIFVLLGLFKGQDESQDAMDAWMSYAQLFAILAIGWFAISRPIPLEVMSLPSVVIGMGAVAVGLILLLIGTLQARSDDFSSFVSGLSFQGAGIALMLLALGWFLGLTPRRTVG